jgi:hypothetical protein
MDAQTRPTTRRSSTPCRTPFTGPGTATFACDDPDVAAQLLVTDIRISAIPLGALSSTALP